MLAGNEYISPQSAQEHSLFRDLVRFVDKLGLSDGRCLEVGTGRGAFQDLVPEYVGIDIAPTVARFIGKPFVVASATHLPFADQSFHAVWTVHVIEHVPEPELAMSELWRVLGPGAGLFYAPAWHCRPWAAEGYPVRPYSDLDWKGRLIKASIPIRDSLAFRALVAAPGRIAGTLRFLICGTQTRFRYRELAPNYEHFWMSDSDALNSMDPFEAYLWFRSRGAQCLNYPTLKEALVVRSGPLIFRKPGTVRAPRRGLESADSVKKIG